MPTDTKPACCNMGTDTPNNLFMRRFYLFLTSLVVAIAAMAEGIDRNAALQKAQRFMPGKEFTTGKTMLSARAMAPQEHDAFYVFNAKDGDGFVIVSGDDRTMDILGYSEHGSLDTDNLPENVKWWLDSYASQIKALGTSLVPVVRNADAQRSAAIAPLIKTAWDQIEPYNYMCPDGQFIDYDEPGYHAEMRSLTGCVATAMAQIMYYWKWPETCPALEGYQINPYFSIKALPATSFEYDKMKEYYGEEETGPAVDAVAKLMRYCGQATNMSYSPVSSEATLTPEVLASVFQYSPNCHELHRNGYSPTQWEEIVYDELAAKRPVIYAGYTREVGHQFIVDGCDGNGFFHINWGWGGARDSYFVLSVGGQNVENGIPYIYNQRAFVGLKPAEAGETIRPLILSNIDETTPTTIYHRTSTASNFTDVQLAGTFYAQYSALPSNNIDVELGWGLLQNDAVVQILDRKVFSVQPMDWWYYQYYNLLSFGAGLADGQYELRPVHRFAGDSEWKICDSGNSNQLRAEVKGNTMKVGVSISTEMSFKVNSITISDAPSKNDVVGVSVNITNTNWNDELKVGMWVKGENTDWENTIVKPIILNANDSADIKFSFVPEEVGTYQIKITAGGTEEALGTATVKVVDGGTVTIDGVTYKCVPEYRLAKVPFQEGYYEDLKSVTILPKVTYNGVDCKVTAIEDYAFYYSDVTSVTISEGVETIGDYAFSQMSNLMKLELPSTIKKIGEGVIEGDNELLAVVSHISNPFDVSFNTFSNYNRNDITDFWEYMPSPATLYVPIGTKAAYEALPGWTWFANIEEGEVKEMMVDGLKYFFSTGGTTATVVQDDSYQAKNRVEIPAAVDIDGKTYRVTAVGNRAFYFCRELFSLTLPEGMESIGNYAFAYTSLQGVTLPSTLKTIGERAFYANNIDALVIPEGVETIGQYALANNFNLTKLELPSTLKKIGMLVINNDGLLENVYSHITNPYAIRDDTFISWWNEDMAPSPATLHVPVGTKAKYEALSGWTWFANIVEDLPNDVLSPIAPRSHSDAWYTLQGVKTEKPQKGVFIKNGRKVIMK